MKRALPVVLSLLALFAAPTASAQDYVLNIGSLSPKGTPWRDLLESIERQIEAESGGRIDVVLQPPGVMSEVELVRETRSGERLQGCGVTTAAIAEGGNVDRLQLIELPYLFRGDAEADHVLDDVIRDELAEDMKRRGFVLTTWSENGWRSFAVTGPTPILTPADLRDKRMRAQESRVHLAMYEQLGAQAVPKPMTEVLTSLQSGVIDGLDNTPLYLKLGGFTGPLTHLTLTRHIYQPAAIIVSRRWFETLPPDLQAVVLHCSGLAVPLRAALRAQDANVSELLRDDLQVHTLSAEQRAAFEAQGVAIHDRFAATIEGGPELLQKIRSALAPMR